MYTILAKDFSQFPAGRFRTDGPHSGQRFREEFLAPALSGSLPVTVILDGTLGYSSAWLEEAFGGLVRESRFRASYLHNNLVIVSPQDGSLIREIWLYINKA